MSNKVSMSATDQLIERGSVSTRQRLKGGFGLTLLAPAKDIKVAKAAIQAGADAVYIGAPLFGARQAAGNSIEDLAALVQYAHLYGVEVLVTLNTLLREEEYAEAVRLSHALYQIGVDALIIQDLRLLRYDLPPIRLHASTQCDNRTAEQVIRLQEMGFRRVVLARELSIEEIAKIHEAVVDYSERQGVTPIEIEAFVHGALCVSYSGRCNMSEVLLGRSANRGCCAQMCRMQYDLLDEDMAEIQDEQGMPIHQQYLLSLQDMDRSAYLEELIAAGVTTFKIEGRLKDSDYVTNITAYYRQRLDALYPNDNQLIEYDFVPHPEKTFHRGGIDYFLHGRRGGMVNRETPKSTGEYVGRVISAGRNTLKIKVAKGVVLHNGDGICYGDQGFQINRVEGDLLYPRLPLTGAIRQLEDMVGVELYRNMDTVFERSLSCKRRIWVDIVFRETATGFRIGMGEVHMDFAYVHEAAKQAEKAVETIRMQLGKLGDTPFVARSIVIESKAYFIPIGVLNQWRRAVVEALIEARIATSKPQPMQHERIEMGSSVLYDTSEKQHLMTCRYCLLHELGHCRKVRPMPREPRYLRLRNGTLLRLRFDCGKCQMLIDKE